MDLVFTDPDLVPIRQTDEASADFAFGYDENDFEMTCDAEIAPPGNGYVLVDGTEWFAVVDSVDVDTADGTAVCKGRTVHGMLAGKRLCPDSGKDKLSVSGDANSCIASVVARVGLGGVLQVSTDPAPSVSYSFERFCDAYSGITSMLKSSGLRLHIECVDCVPVLSAKAVETFGDEADSDRVDISVKRVYACTNHLLCAGEGEGAKRAVLHLYADANGKVSKKQAIFGAQEITAFYDYTSADAEELEERGTEKLEDMHTIGSVTIDAPDGYDMRIGDVVTGRDNANGTSVTAEVSKIVVKYSYGVADVQYEVGSESLGTSNSTISGTAESSGGGGHAYYAGEGLTLANYTFAADVTEADLNAVSATATNAAAQASNASAAAGAAQQAAEKAQETADGKADKSHTHAYLPLTGGTVAGGVLLSNGDKEANFGVVREVDAGKVRGTIKVKDDGTVSFLTKNETTGLYPNQLNLSPTATTLTRPLTLSSGGTGASSANAARYNLFNGVEDVESTPNDGTVMLFAYQSPTSAGDAVYRNTAGRFWAYIKTKASTVFAAKTHTHSYAGSSTAGGAADSAKKWDTPRKITLTGAVNGSATLDGSQDVTITVEGDQAAAGFLAAHPVGSVIETVAGVNPNDVGGTWVQLPSVGLIAWKRTE